MSKALCYERTLFKMYVGRNFSMCLTFFTFYCVSVYISIPVSVFVFSLTLYFVNWYQYIIE